jgi:hypothetical protein
MLPNSVELSRRFRITSHATVHNSCDSKYDRRPGSDVGKLTDVPSQLLRMGFSENTP